MIGDQDHKERLEQARKLVQHLESGEDEQADEVLQRLAGLHESAMFQELGRLTRLLHEAINGFLQDERLQALADHEMEDAAERLAYVIEMTEKSTNTTLGAVEQAIPLVDQLTGRAEGLGEQWQRLRNRELSVEDFRTLSSDLSDFFSLVADHGPVLNGQLNEVLLAQEFQDLTGQIIRKVIHLVQDVEDSLVQIIRLSGARKPGAAPVSSELQKADDGKGHGPVVPGVDAGDLVQGQDDVDDLLSSLGF